MWNLPQNPYDTTHCTLGMLLHYPQKLKVKFSADIQQIWKKMQTNCISSEPVILPIVGWGDQEHLFVHIEDKVRVRLRELQKQKLSALRASSTVRICQLLCTAPLETFQMQVLTNNPGQRRPLNKRLPWYLTDSPVVCGLSSWLRAKSLTVWMFSSVQAQIDVKYK